MSSTGEGLVAGFFLGAMIGGVLLAFVVYNNAKRNDAWMAIHVVGCQPVAEQIERERAETFR